MAKTSHDTSEEIALLRRRLSESETRAQMALGRLQVLSSEYWFDTNLARVALLAMVLANALAYAWANS